MKSRIHSSTADESKADSKSSTSSSSSSSKDNNYYASKELIKSPPAGKKQNEKDVTISNEYPIQVSLNQEELILNTQLKEETTNALSDKDWNKVQSLSLKRLELVPDSVTAGKLLSHSRFELGKIYIKEKKYTAAVAILKESLPWKQMNLGTNHSSIAEVLHELGNANLGCRKIKECKAYAKQALSIYDIIYTDKESPEYVAVKNKLESLIDFSV